MPWLAAASICLKHSGHPLAGTFRDLLPCTLRFEPLFFQASPSQVPIRAVHKNGMLKPEFGKLFAKLLSDCLQMFNGVRNFLDG